MKRLRDLLLSISVLFSIFALIFMIANLIFTKTTVELSSNSQISKEISRLKQDITELGEGECKTFLNETLFKIEKGNFNGSVKIKDLYNYINENAFLPTYTQAKEKCNITDEETEKYNLNSKYLGVIIMPDLIIDKYYFNYEFHLKDELRRVMEPDIDSITFNSYRLGALRIISDYIDIVNERSN